uniref:GTP-binding protein Era n=1 Tax=Panagrolaimus davidi TaxID=227884 RepID=A0A914P253_9BILA
MKIVSINNQPQEIIGDKNDKSTRAFADEVRKTVEAADIIIEVLDARYPLGREKRAIEKSVISQGKRLVFLLNKIDLVPKANITAWHKI